MTNKIKNTFIILMISTISYSNELSIYNNINKEQKDINITLEDNNLSILDKEFIDINYSDPYSIYGGIENYDGEEVTVEEHHNNGNLSRFETYINGVLNGESIGYYWNGNIYWEKNYKNGLADGIVKTYYRSGSLKGEFLYKDGTFIKTIKKYRNLIKEEIEKKLKIEQKTKNSKETKNSK